ncbi:hypothetical protein UG55_10528 [Frankia sp. EI5c]|uniref:hypothetical protein n=1 Tax=Frankia sp. EI5c TaxID=683316 RepID=UPI0007C34B83|nr:hypothetical protein [Frankia sp. EI5c]OAA22006.1 hypothetical protein UG55_10528 [Frankia sp. EI5c]
MLPFDSNDYRRRVLAAVHARGGAEQSDPFEIYDIPIGEVPRLDDAEVRARVDEVWAFWQRSRDHPRYRGVIIALLGLHGELSAALATAASRAELAERVAAARAARDDERFAELDAAVRRLVGRFGGLPEDKIAGLRALAGAQGVDEAAFALRIRRYRVLPAGAPERTGPAPAPRPVPAEVMRQIRADLDELGRIVGTPPPRSLFDLLGVAPGSRREEIRAVRDAAAARNRERRPDRRRALLDDLLTAVHSLLVDGDPEAYLDALVEPVKAALRPRVATAVLIEDRLLHSAAAEFVAHAEAEGLDPARARTVVADLAREHGVEAPAVASSPPGRPGSRGPSGSPDWSGTSGASGAHPSGGGPHTGPVPVRPAPARAGDWQAILSRARAALRAGRPIAASDEITRAREVAGETLPPIRALGDEVERVIRAAGESWRAVVAELAANRQRAVARLTEELARVAADVPGPEGRVLDEVRAQAVSRCAQADELVRRARAASGPEGARLAREALALVADHEEARALVSGGAQVDPARPTPAAGLPLPEPRQVPPPPGAAQTPAASGPPVERRPPVEPRPSVAPPSGVAARWDGASVVITWQPTTTAGDVRYRIRRITADGNARAVGVTSATTIEDGGVFRGSSIPEYEVIAGVGGVWSTPARWPDPGLTAGQAGQPTRAAASFEVPPPGPRTAADEVGPAGDLRVVAGRLCWNWPVGCTEMMVTVRADIPPAGAQELGSTTRKVTNTRYDIDGGFMLPDVRPLHVAIFACVRERGELVVAGAAAGRCLIDAAGTFTVIGSRSPAAPASVAPASVAPTPVAPASVAPASVAPTPAAPASAAPASGATASGGAGAGTGGGGGSG